MIVLLGGCGRADPQNEPDPPPHGEVFREGDLVKGTGTVRWFDIEGGFYAIRGDNEITYDPINLPANFQKNGMRVYFEARLRQDLAGTHMVGPLVDIITIKEQ